MRILYWDTFAGISGDMALGSLIASGADPIVVEKSLQSMGLAHFRLSVSSTKVNGIQATDIEVLVEESKHTHRHLHDIETMILAGEFSNRVKEQAIAVFKTLAHAEAMVHGTTIDRIHFHEVGAVDSIVDIVGTCLALEMLNIDQVIFPSLPWSSGFVECAHGKLPLPAPATLEILAGYQFYPSGVVGELITPTGAALLKTLGFQSVFPNMKLSSIGYGAGKNNYGIPNLLRAIIGEK